MKVIGCFYVALITCLHKFTLKLYGTVKITGAPPYHFFFSEYLEIFKLFLKFPEMPLMYFWWEKGSNSDLFSSEKGTPYNINELVYHLYS